MSAESKYAVTGLDAAKIASLDACDLAHEAWWEAERNLGWCAGLDPFALRIAFNAGWYFCSKRAASAIEARSDATGTGAAEGESAVPQADAPKVSQ